MTSIKHYKAGQFLSSEIAAHLKKWGAPVGFYKDFKRASSIYSLQHEHNQKFIDGLADISLSYRDAFVDYLKEMQQGLRNIRHDMRRREDYNPVMSGIVDGRIAARNIFRDAFPRSTVIADEGINKIVMNANSEVIDSDYVIIDDVNGYYPRNYINIKPFWHKLVYKRGIALAKSTDGVKFVLSAVKLERKYLADKNITAFKVKAVGFKHKKAVIQDGYLTIYDYEVPDCGFMLHTKQHALHNTLQDAVSILDRRIERAVFGAME